MGMAMVDSSHQHELSQRMFGTTEEVLDVVDVLAMKQHKVVLKFMIACTVQTISSSSYVRKVT